MNKTPSAIRKDRVTLGVQAAVIAPDAKILLVRHGYRPGWHFPGGGVEKNETLYSALERELDEETGIELTEAPELFGIYSHFEQFPGDHIVVFVARHWIQPKIPPPNREIVEQCFFAVDKLPQATPIGCRRRISEIYDAVAQVSTW